MDLIRAQHLLIKIQAFLENGNAHTLSRLEKDLVKSYLLQLYEIVTEETPSRLSETEKAPEPFVQKNSPPEVPSFYTPRTAPPDPEPKMTFERIIQEVKEVVPEVKITAPEPPPPIPPIEPFHEPVVEPVREIFQQPSEKPEFVMEADEDLKRLFDMPNVDDHTGRFSHFPIGNIESALGLNERIFTLNDLFGGDRVLFDSTCLTLNELPTYAEACALLMKGPARQYKWTDPERIRMAEHFVRIVARRYPKQ